MAAPATKQPKLTKIAMVAIPRPDWRAEHGRKGAKKPTHPFIVVISYIDEEGDPWIYDELSGLRRIQRPPVISIDPTASPPILPSGAPKK